MLTDLHVHLRPDEEGTTADDYFTAENAATYREAASERGIQLLGVSEHIYRFTRALDVWQHPFWLEWSFDDIDAYCSFVRDQTDLLLGIEADFVAGREEQMGEVLAEQDWDYVIGSVHFLRDEALDIRGEYDIWRSNDPEEVWTRYFSTLADAARSGLYDLMAHPDLVKVWGRESPPPDGDLRRFYEPAVEAFVAADVAVEVSTAGLRKPVGEIYPARQLLELCLEAGTPIVLSSDAHVPEHLGFGYDEAVALLRELGVTEIATFERRERRLVPLG